jgi:WD40 repeat protein
VGNYDNGTVRFYDLKSWKALPVMQPSVGHTVLSTAFSADGQHFAAAGTNGLTLWRTVWTTGDQPTGPISFQLLGRLTEEFSSSICFSIDGNWLAWLDGRWGEEAHRVHVWDLHKLQPQALSMARSRYVMKGLGFYPDSKCLAFVSDKLTIAVWDVTTKKELASFGELMQRGLESPKTHLSADGAWYAVADQTVTIWDMEAKKLLVALSPQRRAVCSVGWSPNRELLAVGGADGVLEIWNLPKINDKLAEIGLGW